MPSPHECDQFAAEFQRRFDALINWAHQHWPDKNQPLQAEDFSASRREVALLLGARLRTQPTPDANLPPAAGGEQYVSVAPAPWP